MLAVAEIGWKAHAALTATRGCARVVARLSQSTYLSAGDTIVWHARPGSLLHPRAILTTAALESDAGVVRFDLDGARCWQADSSNLPPRAAATIVVGCQHLHSAITTVGVPEGFGVMLGPPTAAERVRETWERELIERGGARARALAAACRNDDSACAVEEATALLGLGPGLTPSGDDYVGGAFFARALLARAGAALGSAGAALGSAGAARRDRWAEAGAQLLARAPERTHPISVALLADLVEGDGPAPLHDLARALANGAPLDDVVAAAKRLVAIGHSSGWDILAGFVGGLIGDY